MEIKFEELVSIQNQTELSLPIISLILNSVER